MKKLIPILFLLFLNLGCTDKGITTLSLNGHEENLPADLKGLRVYNVSLGEGEYIKVGVRNNEIKSFNYKEGKYTRTIIIINDKKDTRTIYAKEIISETDSIMVIKK